MADPVEQFNQHQTDTKARFNFLVQSIFLLAGGALTASIAVLHHRANACPRDGLGAWLVVSCWVDLLGPNVVVLRRTA